MPTIAKGIKDIKSFKSLLTYFCDELNWPIDPESSEEEITFDYDPEELGIIKSSDSTSIIIKQLRPPASDWPWGIFYIDFSKNKLPVVLLRSILRQFVEKKRRQNPNQPVWKMSDLIFISFFGSGEEKGTSIVHFIQKEKGLPEIKAISWDQHDTDRHVKAVECSLSRLEWPADSNDSKEWRQQWESAFKLEHRYVVKTSPQLAIELARCAKRIRRHILSVLEIELEDGPLHKLYEDFKKVLIHDLTEDDFADMYAQTISYGLFSARCMDDDDNLHIWEIVRNIPRTNPFLKNLLSQCLSFQEEKEGKISLDDLGIYELVDLLNNTDTTAIQDDFGKEKPGEDPVIHLYEGFMREYDAKQKIRRGEFYTPDAVVSYIVNSVDHLLKNDFGCPDGLADISTWGELLEKGKIKMPEGMRKNSKEGKKLAREPFVQVLDPATGTGTFLKHVILKIYDNLNQKWREEGSLAEEINVRWNTYVPKHLLPRLYGFELKMAPYSVAHMKLAMTLQDTRYEFKGHERLNIFLTNTLEPPHKYSGTLFAQFLSREAEESNIVKSTVPITVVVGNPPYSGHSANLTEQTRALVGRFKYIDGVKIKERGALQLEKNLQDDYIKFLAFAEDRLNFATTGICGMICNHGFVDNPTLRGVRWSLLNNFRKIWIFDLHGNVNRGEKAKDGSNDQNVFDIKDTGVAIFIGLKGKIKSTPNNKIFKNDLWGDREDHKYPFLRSNNCSSHSWKNVACDSELFLFRTLSEQGFTEYTSWPKITEIFKLHSIGMITARDSYVIDFTPEPILERAKAFRDSKLNDEATCKSLGIPLKKGWNIARARAKIKSVKNLKAYIQQVLYRPFDIRPVFYHESLIWGRAWPVMQHMVDGKNLALITSRMTKGEDFHHVLVSDTLSEVILLSSKTSNNAFAFPLHLQSKKTDLNLGDFTNFTPHFLDLLANKLRLTKDNVTGIPHSLTAEDIFNYIYCALHSPSYRNRYVESLKIDFPRLPLTSSLELFQKMAKIGSDLVDLHLMKSSKLNNYVTKFISGKSTEVERISWSNDMVCIDKDKSVGFKGVSREIWNFYIGGYQVCEKWLKSRKGRQLSKKEIEHYQKIIVLLSETSGLMSEVDKIIDTYGGWPKAFV
ncbi:MAG: type ISP restriction/modification enzyme [Candidatus Zapsychrus exili]|nr:type ISP restriction/modification enzyme [Candidatus Zapsychrus exili]